MQLAYPAGMGDESIRRARRREKLRALLKDNGGAAAVAREVSTPKSYFSAILAGDRGLGDDLAEKLEVYFALPPGWFDQEESAYWALLGRIATSRPPPKG